MKKQIDLIYKLMALSQRIKPYPSEIKVIKLMEEVGELSECVTKLSGYKTHSENPEDIKKELFKEICDIFIMIVSLGQEFGMTTDTFQELLSEKIDKWWHKHLKQYITDPNDIPVEYQVKKEEKENKKSEDPFQWIKDFLENPDNKPFEGDPITIKPLAPLGELFDRLFNPDKYEGKGCLHDSCIDCHGTGNDRFGRKCVHMISCPCPKCTPSYFNINKVTS